MINEISLKNFKTFDDEVFNIAPLTLIMGINGMGKSSILQSLLLLKQNYANESFNREQKIARLEGDFVSLEDSQSLCYTWADERCVEIGLKLEGSNHKWLMDAEEDDNIDLTCVYEGNESKVKSVFGDGFIFLSADRLLPQKEYTINSVRTYNTKLGINGELTPGYLYKALNANEELAISEMADPEVQGIDKQLVNNVNAWMSWIMSMPMTTTTEQIDNQRVRMLYSIGGIDGESYSPLQVGFGLTYTLPIVTSLLIAKSGDVVLIENPEAHLHPSAQVRLGQMISKAVSLGVQVIAETHSDHIINGVRLARKENVLKKDDDVNLIFVQRKEFNGKLISYVNDVQINNSGKFSEPLPPMFNTWKDTLVKLL
jgi:predicted ATPase